MLHKKRDIYTLELIFSCTWAERMKKFTGQQANASQNELQYHVLDLEFFRHAGLQGPDRAVMQSFQHSQKPSSISLKHLHQDTLGWRARPWSLQREIRETDRIDFRKELGKRGIVPH